MKKHIWWLAALVGFLIYAGLIEPFWIDVKTHHLMIPGFPAEPVSLVHIADTHTTRTGFREKKLAEIIERIRPDYVFITGDLLKTHSRLDEGLSFTSMLDARMGVFAVCGNADAAIYAARAKGSLRGTAPHLKVLFNESVDCSVFTLVGLDDPVLHRDRPGEAMAGVDFTRPVVVLTHFHPEGVLEELSAAGADLVLSAHTHGGQLGIAALVRIVPYASRGDYIAGLFRRNGMYLHVTKGIGTNIFPFRFMCRPQVDVFYINGNGE